MSKETAVVKTKFMTLFMATLILPVGVALAQVQLKSPDNVQKALTTLNRVVDHTDRLIKAKNYVRLPHENGEFKEGVEALEKSIADEPTDFRSGLKKYITQASSASQHVADAAADHDDAKLASTHAEFADAVKQLIAQFPSSVGPKPPSVVHEKTEDQGHQ
jgi:hypothetical protein